MDLKNCYKILEIQQTASLPEIKRAYRDMIGIWHPDRFVQNPRLHEKATEKLKELNIAYNELIKQITSGIINNNSGPKTSRNGAHLIIVTCPDCKKKNRIKAGFVMFHPRCGACGHLLFQKKKTRQNGKKRHEEKDSRLNGAGPRDRTFGRKTFSGQTLFREAPAAQDSRLKSKRRFWNKWTISLSAISIGMLIANAGDIRHTLNQGLKQISEGRYTHYFKVPSQAPPMKEKTAADSAEILRIQQALQKLGYDISQGVGGKQTLATVQQFRDDYFLEFRVDDVSEITRALQRQHAILTLHPDWPQIARDTRFKSWIGQQTMTSPKICRDLLAFGETNQVDSLINWYKFDGLKPHPVSMPRNGALQKNYHKGLAPLTIQTRNDGRHYYLKLLNASNGREVLSAFLRGGSTLVEYVPLGKHELKYAVGDVWYGTRWLFGPQTVFKKLDQVFEFKIHNNEIAGYRLNLYLQSTGSAGAKKNYAFDF